MYFALKLIPSRPDFAFIMSEEEKSIMQQHTLYWTGLMSRGIVVVYGPVFDPKGPYGFGVIKVESEEDVKAIISSDPATRINKYEYYPMRAIAPNFS
jgi:uncharacterized protein YciI